jgi:hypothetical protein
MLLTFLVLTDFFSVCCVVVTEGRGASLVRVSLSMLSDVNDAAPAEGPCGAHTRGQGAQVAEGAVRDLHIRECKVFDG